MYLYNIVKSKGINHLIILGIATLGLLFFISVHASDFQSPRTVGLGGAGHASPLFTDAIYLNPSFISFISTYALSLNYLAYSEGNVNAPASSSDYSGNNTNISAQDGNRESIIQSGIGYTHRDDSSMVHVGISHQFFDRISIGMGSKLILPRGDFESKKIDATFSFSGIITDWFRISFVADNIFESASSFGFYREYTLGTKLNIFSLFQLYIDPNWTPTLDSIQTNLGQINLGYEIGAEFPFLDDFSFRLGGFRNSNIPFQAQRGNGYGIGLGWVGPKFSLDYAFSITTQPINSNSHNIGGTIYF